MLEFNTSKEIAKKIGDRIEQERISYEFTQEELARRAGIPLGTYRTFLHSQRISLLNLITLFQVLNLYTTLDEMAKEVSPKTLSELEKRKYRVRKNKK